MIRSFSRSNFINGADTRLQSFGGGNELLNKRSIARRLIIELNIPDLHFAFVGGSVGRGDDDEWSDIDLTICVEDESYHCNKNIIFEGEAVQLYITHPYKWEAVEQNPLEYRFILESFPVYDPNDVFASLQEKVRAYFHSTVGKQRIYTDWINLVCQRQNWARENILAGKMHSATVAAGVAYIDAAFMLLYFKRSSLSSGGLIPFLENNNTSFAEFTTICHWLDHSENDVSFIIRTIEQYREHLRSQTSEHWSNFDLSPIQDILMSNKAKRMIRFKQFTNLKWQFHGEAFGLFLSFSHGHSLEDHLMSLPDQLRNDLRTLGFVALSVNEVERMIELSEELVSLVQQH